MRAVNLLPGESRHVSRAPQPAALAAAVAGVVVVAVVGGGNLLETARVSSAQKTLNSAKIQLAATPLPPPTPEVTPPPAAVAEQMQPRLEAVSNALSTRIAWDRILREFSLVLPSDIQLSVLDLTQPTSSGISAAGAANNLQLTGVTYSYDSVARLLARLQLVPDLTDVTLGQTSVSQGVVQFSITAGVKGAPAPVVPVAPPVTTTTSGATS